MWPTVQYSSAAGPAMPRRAKAAAALGLAALLAITVAATWYSSRAARSRTPVYAVTGAGAATWAWDGNAYRLLSSGEAGPRSSRIDMAYDATAGATVLWDHGCAHLVMGFTGGCTDPVNRTWTLTAGGWTEHPAAGAPRESGRGAMLYSARLGAAVYVNGAGRAWTFRRGAWSALAMPGGPDIGPPGSAGAPALFAAGFDGSGALVLMVGARTWTWDGAGWASRAAAVPESDAGPDPRLVLDADRDRLLYMGRRSTWTWDGAAWTAHPAPPFAAPAAAYDPGLRAVLAVDEDAAACAATGCPTVTWAWDGGAWRRLSTAGRPQTAPGRATGSALAMAYDEQRALMLLVLPRA